MQIDFSEWPNNMKIFVVHVNTHQRMTSADEDFNNQMNSHSTIPGILLLQKLLSLPNTLITKVTVVAGMEVIHGLRNMNFKSSRLTWLQPLLSAQPASSRGQQSQYGTIPQGDLPATWWQIDYIGPLLSCEGQHIVLTGIDTYFGYGFAFLTNNAFAKNTVHRFIECLICHHSISHNIVSDQGTHFTVNGPMLMEFTGFSMFPIILKALA